MCVYHDDTREEVREDNTASYIVYGTHVRMK